MTERFINPSYNQLITSMYAANAKLMRNYLHNMVLPILTQDYNMNGQEKFGLFTPPHPLSAMIK